MANYQEVRVKLTNSQLNELKFAVKTKTGTILKLYRNKCEDEKLLHELLLTIWKKLK